MVHLHLYLAEHSEEYADIWGRLHQRVLQLLDERNFGRPLPCGPRLSHGRATRGETAVAAFPADAQAPEAVEPGDGPFDDPAEDAQARAVRLASFRDHGTDAPLPKQPTVLVVVVAAIGRPVDALGGRRGRSPAGSCRAEAGAA